MTPPKPAGPLPALGEEAERPVRRLVLFDIDGTLLSAGGVSSRAMAEALIAGFGTTGAAEAYDYSGKTDPQIVRELMRGAGISDERDRRADARGPGRLPGASRRAPATRARARQARSAARWWTPWPRTPRVTLGLLTGNLEPCARLKLAPLGLNGTSRSGPTGPITRTATACRRWPWRGPWPTPGAAFAGEEVVIMGDSIHDVLCGRSLGVRAVAVATGKTPRERLAEEQPHALLDDLSDTAHSLEQILGALR